jgi:molecular chaperone GrpE
MAGDGIKEKNIEELKKELEDCAKKSQEYLSGWQRSRADFLNYKKEEMERIAALMAYAGEELILKILPVLDNFEIALNKLPENLKSDNNVKGVLQINNQIADFLKSQGVEEIKSVGQNFDPNFHEVVGPAPAEASAGKQSGIIIDEVQKGYKINGRLLRPAKVRVVK